MSDAVVGTGNKVENKILAVLGLTFLWAGREIGNNYIKVRKTISDMKDYQELNDT